MGWQEWLGVASNVAQVVTGIAAALAAGAYLLRKRYLRRELETFLQLMRGPGAGEDYALPTRAIALALSCTEAEVMYAAYASRKIARLPSAGEDLARLYHNGLD